MPASVPAPRRGLLVAIALAATVVVAEVSWLVWSIRSEPSLLAPPAAAAEAPPAVVPQVAGSFDLSAELASIDASYLLAPDRRFVAAGELLRTWTGAEPLPVPDGDFEARLAALRTQATPIPSRNPARGLRDASPLALSRALRELSDALDAGAPDTAAAAAGAELMGVLGELYADRYHRPDVLVGYGLALLAMADPGDPVTIRAHALIASCTGNGAAASAAVADLPDRDAVRAWVLGRDAEPSVAALAPWDGVARELAAVDAAADGEVPDAPWPRVWRRLGDVDSEPARLAVLAAPADVIGLCAMAAARPELAYLRIRRDSDVQAMASLNASVALVDRRAETLDALVAAMDTNWRAEAPSLVRDDTMWRALCLDPLAEALVAHARVFDPAEDPGRWGPTVRAQLASSDQAGLRARAALATRERAAALGTLDVDEVLGVLDELGPGAFERVATAWAGSAPLDDRGRLALVQGAAQRLDDRFYHRYTLAHLARTVLFDDRLAERIGPVDPFARPAPQHDLDRLADDAAARWQAGDAAGAAIAIAAFPYPASDEAWRRSVGPAFARALFGASDAEVAAAATALADAGVEPAVRRALLEALGTWHEGVVDARPGLAFELLDGVPLEGADDWGAIAAMAAMLEHGRGAPAAARWLDATIDRTWREPFALAAWEHGLTDVLWTFVSPDGLPPARADYIWLLRATAPPADEERDALLTAWLDEPPHSHYHHIASVLTARAELGDVAGLAVDRERRCELAWFVGLRARSAGDEDTARAWFRVAVETGAERMVEWRWAWLALAATR